MVEVVETTGKAAKRVTKSTKLVKKEETKGDQWKGNGWEESVLNASCHKRKSAFACVRYEMCGGRHCGLHNSSSKQIHVSHASTAANRSRKWLY
uniref:C3H1-type domain-containing protein n=1 Tax=Heterorhabditis bacteriophora TaxID=37862 RepID=A0A1I7XSZ1_HETBA